MYVEPWFSQELKLIDPEFSAFWDRKAERWLIIKYTGADIFRKNYVVEYCVSKDKEFTPLDRRALLGLQRTLWAKNRMRELDDHLKELKESDDELFSDAWKAWQFAKREFMKRLYILMFTKTFT